MRAEAMAFSKGFFDINDINKTSWQLQSYTMAIQLRRIGTFNNVWYNWESGKKNGRQCGNWGVVGLSETRTAYVFFFI